MKPLQVGPLEREGDNMNMGLLPLLDYGPHQEEGQQKILSRRDLANEMEAFLNKRTGRCR